MSRNRNQRAARRATEQLERRVRSLEEHATASCEEHERLLRSFSNSAMSSMSFHAAVDSGSSEKTPLHGHARRALRWLLNRIVVPAVSVAIGMTLAGFLLFAMKL